MLDHPQPSAAGDFSARYQAGAFADLFSLAPGELDAALSLPRPLAREPLADALAAYATRLAAPKRVFASLEALRHPESRVVVTGQQAGLLLGPTFTLSKAVTAINLAARLSTPDKPVVPVFWVASQDHDSAEIDHAQLLDLDESLTRLELPFPEGVPAGRIPLESSWLALVLSHLQGLNVHDAYREQVRALLEQGAAVARTIADWFAAILYRVLGEAGLVIIDPLEPAVAPFFTEHLAHELRNPLSSSARINEAAEVLKGLGEIPQLGRAADATNLFIEEDAHDGVSQRRLLRFDGQAFFTETRRYARDELLALLARDPSCLTPAAGLRPVLQDAVLPTAVTVVGPGELRYFAQLRGVYEAHEVAMPLIQPRMTLTVLEPPARRMLEKFSLRAAELQADPDGARHGVLLALHGHKERFDESLAVLAHTAEALTQHVEGIDPTLKRSVARGAARIHHTFELLRSKSGAALAKQDDITRRQFDRLKAQLLPNGQPQERVLSPFSFFLKFGVEPVVRALLALEPEGHHELPL